MLDRPSSMVSPVLPTTLRGGPHYHPHFSVGKGQKGPLSQAPQGRVLPTRSPLRHLGWTPPWLQGLVWGHCRPLCAAVPLPSVTLKEGGLVDGGRFTGKTCSGALSAWLLLGTGAGGRAGEEGKRNPTAPSVQRHPPSTSPPGQQSGGSPLSTQATWEVWAKVGDPKTTRTCKRPQCAPSLL